MRHIDYLVLGGGAGGLYSAKAIRDNTDKEILIISNEKLLPYRRPQLTKDMMGSFNNNEKAVFKKEWYEKNNIQINLNEKVISINPEEKTVVSDKDTYTYGKLIYALGAKCFIPPIAGSDLPEVVVVRDTLDIDKIQSLKDKVNKVVVIGGGVLGLEAAYEMYKINKEVTVLEVMPQIMGRQLDITASNLLMDIVEKHGVDIQVGVNIEKIDGEDKVKGILLKDGTYIECDMVIVSAGISSNVEIAKNAGIECGRSIIVDNHMKTNLEDIYACGDCAQFNGVNTGLWTQAMAMAKVAGNNASGKEEEYQLSSGALTFNDFDTKLFAIGDAGKVEGQNYIMSERFDEEKGIYEKFYSLNDLLVGAILIGNTSKMSEVLSKINKPKI